MTDKAYLGDLEAGGSNPPLGKGIIIRAFYVGEISKLNSG